MDNDNGRTCRIARFLVTVLKGLSIQACDGASRVDLKQVAGEVVAGIRACDLLN